MQELSASLPVEVRTSPIHGRGLFATGAIPAGIMIAEYVGEKITWSEGLRREDAGQGDYLFDVEGQFMIDGAGLETDGARVNHSCAPNCDIEILDSRIFIVSRRDIAPGEEISFDYNFDPAGAKGEDPRKAFPCRCGAPTCRGTMVDLG
jgi:SET domain-containing protein